jgi:hypothetical protein
MSSTQIEEKNEVPMKSSEDVQTVLGSSDLRKHTFLQVSCDVVELTGMLNSFTMF